MNKNSKSCPTNGGKGAFSYFRNSSFQRTGNEMKKMIFEAISENFDIENLSPALNTIYVADLGCSSGPNTYIAMQNVIEAVENKFQTTQGLISEKIPEFHVFFNDLSKNDFNTLFASLPPEKKYFAYGVPGSFHGPLFPESSLHIVHASYALHWLSEVPKEVLLKDSPAYNVGRIYYSRASDAVASAYAAQFAEDMDNLLNFRATEIVVGGMMLLVMPAMQDGFHRSQSGAGVVYDALGTSLMDMANEGLISKEQVDAFNLPIYTTFDKEMAGLVERNGRFSIEKMELMDPMSMIDEPIDMKVYTTHIRAVLEELLIQHFGGEIIDELFHRFYHEAKKYSQMDSTNKKGTLLFLALKRKP